MLVRGTRTLNVILLVVAVIGLVATLGEWRAGGGAFPLLASLVWLAPLFQTWRALGESATARSVKAATIANFVLLAFFAVGVLRLLVRDESGMSMVVPAVVVAAIIALNLRALSRRVEELTASPSISPIARRDAVFTIGEDVHENDGATPASADAPYVETEVKGLYVMRHWRGQLSLPVSYWINGTLLGMLLGAALPALKGLLGISDSLRQVALFFVATICIVYLSWLWSFVGIWRSAGRHAQRGGSAFWGYAARGSVMLGVFGAVVQMVTIYGPQLREFTMLAMGKDTMGEIQATPSPNGDAVMVWGTLREGSAKQVLRVLDNTPGARTVILNSNGGRLLEGRVLADGVRQRKLNTYVEGECSSACTYVLMAGVDRVATPNAKIGFHRASFGGGMDSAVESAAVTSMLNYYRNAGLPDNFVQRVGATPASAVWYPSREELLQARVLTRIALRSESPGMLQVESRDVLAERLKESALYRAFDQRFPGAISRAAERGWAVKTRGGSDAEIFAALRSEMKQALPGVLKNASDEALAEFVKLLAAETNAARNISVDACSQFLDGTLDTSSALPPVLVEEERKTIVQLLKSPAHKGRQPDPYMADAMMRVAFQNLSKDQARALTDKTFGTRQPAVRCDATLKFYQNVASMQQSAQSAVLWSMYRR